MTAKERKILQKKAEDAFESDFGETLSRANVLFEDIKDRGTLKVSLEAWKKAEDFEAALVDYMYNFSDSTVSKEEKLGLIIDRLAELKIVMDEMFIIYVLSPGKEDLFAMAERAKIKEIARG